MTARRRSDPSARSTPPAVAAAARPAVAAAARRNGHARRDIDWAALEAAARAVRAHAHAPYSGYAVGAAVMTPAGAIYVGCNVENASYGLTLCAERAAVLAMVASGEKSLRALFLVTPGRALAMPCGACRQTLAEFAADDLPIRVRAAAGAKQELRFTLGKLLPRAFRAAALRT